MTNKFVLFLLVFFWLFCALTGFSDGAEDFSLPKVLEENTLAHDSLAKVIPSIVTLVSRPDGREEPLGVGFVAAKDGIVVTSYRNFVSAGAVEIKAQDGTFYPVTAVLYVDPSRDLCVLKTAAYGLPPVVFGEADALANGEKIYLFQLSPEQKERFIWGWAYGFLRPAQYSYLRFVSSSLSRSNTGEPLVNQQGEVVGMAIFIRPEGESVALAASEIKPFLDDRSGIDLQHFESSRSQADEYLLKASEALFQQENKQANAFYRKALELNANSAKVYSGLGVCYLLDNQPAQAIPYLEKSIKEYPFDAMAYYNLGSAFVLLKNDPEAIGVYEKAVKLNPTSLYFNYELGTAYFRNQQPKEAIAMFEKALNINPSMGDSYLYLNTTLQELKNSSSVSSNLEKK